MPKLPLVLAVLLLSILAASPEGTRAVQEEDQEMTIFWIFAHPDDETLAAGRAIAESERAGNNNVVIIVSSGEKTLVRERLELTREQVITSRRLEAIQALEIAGVTDVRFLAVPDGQVTAAMIDALVDELLIEAAGKPVAFRGHSPFDSYEGLPCGHHDHCVIGEVLLDRWRSGDLPELELYRMGHLMGSPQVGVCDEPDLEQIVLKREMLQAFAVWEPEHGRYAIGLNSVPAAMERAAFGPECIEHPRVVDGTSVPSLAPPPLNYRGFTWNRGLGP